MCDIDHKYTDEIVCPWCGYKFEDSWEFDDDGEELGLIDCPECYKTFYGTRNISISYSTEKAKYGDCTGCRKVNVVIEDYCSTLGHYKDLCTSCGYTKKREFKKKYFDELESK